MLQNQTHVVKFKILNPKIVFAYVAGKIQSIPLPPHTHASPPPTPHHTHTNMPPPPHPPNTLGISQSLYDWKLPRLSSTIKLSSE